MLHLLEYALIFLARRWRKSLLLILVYALVVAFYASVIFFTAALREETQAVLKDVPELWIQKIAGGRLVPMQSAFMDSLGKIRGVKKVIPRIWGYNFDTPTGAVFTIIGSDSLVQGLEMLETQFRGKLNDSTVLCGTGFLELRGLRLGETLTLLDDQGKINNYQIVGAFKSTSDLISRDLIILSNSEARKLLGLAPTEITDLSLEIANPLEIDNIGRKIDRRFAGIRVVTSEQLQSTYETLFSWRGGIFVYGALMSVMAFLILAWEKASGQNDEEKKELGILKAIGWQITDVLWLKFWEGLVISALATLGGILIAYVHVFWMHAPLLKPFLIGWSVLYPAYVLSPSINLENIIIIVSLSVIPYLSATLVPAWRGAITDPAEVMQN